MESARELLDAYATRDRSPVEVVEECIGRIEALDAELGAFVTLDLECARADARAAERAWRDGRPGALCGVPIAVKDLFDTAGVETACGSAVLAGRVPDSDAEAVRRARAADAVVIGKTATHEFAWGLTMDGATRNPYDLARIPGGSSGGSAVALATGMAPLALGSDTGGSIRLPAAFCGVAGLKPSYGLVSLDGCWPLARTLDHAGPMARTADDCALLLAAIADWTPGDVAVEGLVVGVPEPLDPPVAAAVDAAMRAAADALAAAGARVEPVALPAWSRFDEAFGSIFLAEAHDTHVRAGLWPQRRDEYRPSVASRVALAERVTLPEYIAACGEREALRSEMATVFERVDLLLTPVSAAPAPRIADERFEHEGRTVALREVVIPYTCPQDLLGLPACAVPAGVDQHGVPVGVQVTGPRGGEAAVLAAAATATSPPAPPGPARA